MKKLFLLLLLPLFTFQYVYAEVLNGDTVTVDKPKQENLYIFSASTTIDQPVDGDVIVFAGDVTVNSPISGDLTVAAGNLSLQSSVDGDVRVAGGDVAISSSHVGGDVILAGGTLKVADNVTSSGALMVAGGQINVLGSTTNGDVYISGDDVSLGGTHLGNVYVEASQLKGAATLHVDGDLHVNATSMIDVTKDTVSGALTQGESQPAPQGNMWDEMLTHFLWVFVSTFIMTLVIATFLSSWIIQRSEYIRANFWPTLGAGVVFFIVVPVVSVFLLIAYFTIPTVILILLVYIAMILLANPIIVLYLGRFLVKQRANEKHQRILFRAMIGSFVLAVISIVPYVNLLLLLFVILGMGAMAQSDDKYFGIVGKK